MSRTPYDVKKCDYCGKDVQIFHKQRLLNKHIFCSRECESKYFAENNGNTICPVCGKIFHRKPYHLKRYDKWPSCCSKECSAIYRKTVMSGKGNHQYGLKGNKNASWKSDYRFTTYGYLKKRVLDHPFHDCDGFVLYHKLVAESYLLNDENSVIIDGKRYLNPDLIVHHKNENKLDNNPNNLEIMTPKDHIIYHTKNRNKNIFDKTKKNIVAFVYPLKENEEE